MRLSIPDFLKRRHSAGKSPPSEPTPVSRTFVVDAVQPSKEKLPTYELLPLLGTKLKRDVLFSPVTGRCVASDGNPLVAAVHVAFSRHLPLTLSPDAVWLTIVQGFSHHINENAEALRGRLVSHQGRVKLQEQISSLTIAEMQRAVSGFSRQIREATDPAVHDALICDFTTTTPDVRTASEIALMDAYSQYFEYTMLCICGIPRITLTGSVQDWQRIRDRVEIFETYGLDWWVSRLRPILDEFVRAAEGRPDREFWRAIYKFRPAQIPSYEPDMVTGWIVDLYPYLGDAPKRRRNDALDPGENREVASSAFPSGLCSAEVTLKMPPDDEQNAITERLDLVGGLFAVGQASMDRAVSPIISWALARQAATHEGVVR